MPRWTESNATPELMAPVRVLATAASGAMIEFSSRIWDIEPAGDGGWVAVLVRPDARAAGERTPEAAGQAVLEWAGGAGPLQAPVEITARVGRHGAVWTAKQTGPVSRIQRRDYFRMQLAAAIEVVVADDRAGEGIGDDSPQRRLAGSVVDIGEGGTLAIVKGRLPSAGTQVGTEITVCGTVVRPDAVVVRVVDFPSGVRGLALRFLDPDQYGAPIRTALAEAQRRRARDSRASR